MKPAVCLFLICALATAAEITDVCEVVNQLAEGMARDASAMRAKLLVWEGGTILTTAKNANGKGCAVWVEGRLPAIVLDYVESHPRDGMYSSIGFEVQVAGRIERRRSFRRSRNAPYPGNGFGRHGTYEYQITVRRWIQVAQVTRR